MESKTVYEWLQELHEPYRTEAVQLVTLEMAEYPVNSLSEALTMGFTWQISPQGRMYWEQLYENLTI